MGGLRDLIVSKGYWGAATDLAARIQSDDIKPKGDGDPDARAMRANLVQTIEDSIIPRLLVAQELVRTQDLLPASQAPSAAPVEIGDEHVAAFVALVLAQDSQAIEDYVTELVDRDCAIETVYLKLLTPTARALGDMWVQDLCDFTDVTVALVRLHDLLRDLSDRTRGNDQTGRASKSLLLALCPGEQHMFGMTMAAEFFRHAGWRVRVSYPGSETELGDVVRKDWFHIIGLSCSCDTCFEAAVSALRIIRREAQNDSVGVMAGGQLFSEHPEYVYQVGADIAATDGREAVRQAELLMTERARAG